MLLFWFVIACFGLLFGCFVCFGFLLFVLVFYCLFLLPFCCFVVAVVVCFGCCFVCFGLLLFVVAVLLFCCCCCLFGFLFCFVLSYKLAYIGVLDATMFSNLQFKLSLAIIGGIYSGLTLTDAVVTSLVGPLTDKLVR